jgi:tetratricopeptide (TPR) repeat protein
MQSELPEVDAERMKAAVERAVARAASAALDTEGYRVVDMHLAKVEATEEAGERAKILRDLSEMLAERGDLDRALVVRLSAFSEEPTARDIDPLLRLARVTDRWTELPLDRMSGLVDTSGETAEVVARLSAFATAWQRVGRGYYAADCLERVLALQPDNTGAHDALETFYRSTSEWPALVDLLARRAVQVETNGERAELYRELGAIYDQQLGDDEAALTAYRDADRLEADRPEVLDAIARLVAQRGESDQEALDALTRLAERTAEPLDRAKILVRASAISRQLDYDIAQRQLEQARRDDPSLPAAVDGLASLLRERGDLRGAVTVLLSAARPPAQPTSEDAARWLTDAADYDVALGEVASAKTLYREARAADPKNYRAGVALVELCSEEGALTELGPILDELCRTTEDPQRLRGYLIQRSKIAQQLGDRTGASVALARAVDLDPHDMATKRELAGWLFEAQAWGKARPLLEALLENEDLLPAGEPVELHFRVARCALESGDRDGAAKHAAMALALDPTYKPARLLRGELDADDPVAHAAHQLELANLAPREEKAARFTALGDRYSELGEPATAREMYREALVYRPGDHLLLTKFLTLVADDGDWSYALDIMQRLIDTETDAQVRSRYRHTAALIAREELDDLDRAAALLGQALEDDPRALAIADELEALLAARGDRDALAAFYYRRLEHVRNVEHRAGERLRLWDRLGELLLAMKNVEDAVVAFEVALRLAPSDVVRRQRLADLYVDANPVHDADAIALHHAVLRETKQRAQSYVALSTLYARNGRPDKARACDDALAVLGARGVDDTPRISGQIDELFDPAARIDAPNAPREVRTRALANEDWLALAKLDVDAQLSALFAAVAPALAIERARMRPPPEITTRPHELPPAFARVLARVASVFGVTKPAVALDRELASACRLVLRAQDGALAPALVVGRVASTLDERALAFALARQLADLRSERIARLMFPRAGELARIIEMVAPPRDDPGASASGHASHWLATALHPVELDRALAIGARLRERDVQPLAAATAWLAATERAADRIGLVVAGDLATCTRMLEREGAADRVLDLVWASVTDEVLSVVFG